jgi:hypothetical protein
MDHSITGSCWCGSVEVGSNGPAKFAIMCHCSDCRNASGAGGLPQLAVPRDGVEIRGPIGRFHTNSDSGNALTFGFCSRCGSSIYKETEAAQSLTFLMLGALDKTGDLPDLRPVYADGRPAWDRDYPTGQSA